MTDEQIINALFSCHKNSDCGNCDYAKFRNHEGLCVDMLQADAGKLINHQKAEIERLREELASCIRALGCVYGTGESE